MGSPVYRKDAWTLVEFLDYQCPPCRVRSGKVRDAVNFYHGKVQSVVRNYPLPMHPNATAAAVAVEAAREQGKFWPMHDALLPGGALTPKEVRRIVQKIGLDQARFNVALNARAKARVALDLKQAEQLGVNATPSFLLCSPSGQVWKLDRLDQMNGMVQ